MLFVSLDPNPGILGHFSLIVAWPTKGYQIARNGLSSVSARDDVVHAEMLARAADIASPAISSFDCRGKLIPAFILGVRG